MGIHEIENKQYIKLKKAHAVENGKYVKLPKAYVVENNKYVKCWSRFDARFVGASVNGSYASFDGLEWSRQSMTTLGLSVAYIAFGNDIFVAAGWGGKVSYSEDGLTWTTQTLSVSGHTISGTTTVSFCNNKFIYIAACNTVETVVFESSDGKGWTYIGVIPKNYSCFASTVNTSIVYANYKGSMYYIVGTQMYDNDTSGGQYRHSLWYSSDCLTWTKITTGKGASSLWAIDQLYAVNDILYCFAGYSYYDGSDDAYEAVRVYTFNSSWNLYPAETGSTNKYICASTYNYDTGEFAVITSNYGAEGTVMAITTNRGKLTNVYTNIPVITGSKGVTALAYGNGKYIAICKNGTFNSSSNGISYSSDGINWTVISNTFYGGINSNPIIDATSKNFIFAR